MGGLRSGKRKRNGGRGRICNREQREKENEKVRYFGSCEKNK
jgi:hypothetical protein